MRDLISRQTAIDAFEDTTFTKNEIRRRLSELPPAQPVATDICVGDKISKFIDGLEETFAYIREREGGDSVCGLCEYDGAYIGESGDWCNECPGFNKDDCFKLSDKTRKEWTDEIIKALPTVQPEKAQLSKEGTTSDTISRQQAIDIVVFECGKWTGLAKEISKQLKQLPPAQPELSHTQKSCEYCHEDSDGYTRPIEKNCHAYIRFGMNGWELDLKAKGWHGEAQIKFCPMCGRELKGGR